MDGVSRPAATWRRRADRVTVATRSGRRGEAIEMGEHIRCLEELR